MKIDNQFGLSERDRNTIYGILSKYIIVKRVVIFGSRAKGSYKIGSDVDLAIMNQGVEEIVLAKIKEEFSESSLPYRVDLVDYTKLKHKEFTDHIDRVGIEFYKGI